MRWKHLVLILLCGSAPAHSIAHGKPSSESRALSSPWELPARRDLPPAARDLLGERMKRHESQMTLLLMSVVLLNYTGAESIAAEVAREPRFARPTPGTEDTLNAMLPPRLFDLQDQLTQRAKTPRRSRAAASRLP